MIENSVSHSSMCGLLMTNSALSTINSTFTYHTSPISGTVLHDLLSTPFLTQIPVFCAPYSGEPFTYIFNNNNYACFVQNLYYGGAHGCQRVQTSFHDIFVRYLNIII